jgi:hypothetical protein
MRFTIEQTIENYDVNIQVKSCPYKYSHDGLCAQNIHREKPTFCPHCYSLHISTTYPKLLAKVVCALTDCLICQQAIQYRQTSDGRF